jgi:hypothetical protein
MGESVKGQGADDVERLQDFIEGLYGLYVKTIVRGELTFRGLPVKCQFRPETFGKHYAFWHMMQEGEVEDDRTIDPEGCKRLLWISWLIRNAASGDPRIRVFRQSPRGSNESWVIWLHEHEYAVILWVRTGYFMLRTAFMLKPRKREEFERDWKKFVEAQKG